MGIFISLTTGVNTKNVARFRSITSTFAWRHQSNKSVMKIEEIIKFQGNFKLMSKFSFNPVPGDGLKPS